MVDSVAVVVPAVEGAALEVGKVQRFYFPLTQRVEKKSMKC